VSACLTQKRYYSNQVKSPDNQELNSDFPDKNDRPKKLSRSLKLWFQRHKKSIVSWSVPVGVALTIGLVAALIDEGAKSPRERFSRFLQSAETMAIAGGIARYLMEAPDRKQRKHYEAWQVIDNAAAAKVPTSYARVNALQDLNDDGVSLQGLDVPGADLSGIILKGANLKGADLNGVNLINANLEGANLCGVKLINAKLQGANLSGADLGGADLRLADLINANLSGVNLGDAVLARANLSGVNLSDAVLTRANLEASDLRLADLSGADLRLANLAETVLIRTNLKRANLKRANLSGANLNLTTLPDGSKYHSREQLTSLTDTD
jgi:uncharacterized protein YjbI with pentapeptide repeats